MKKVSWCLVLIFTGVIISRVSISIEQERSFDAGRTEFVDVARIIPTAIMDIRYATANNFTGKPVRGYDAPKCLLTKPAAQALAQVEKEFKKFSLSLVIYDCYRPGRAVDNFVEWAKDPNDAGRKMVFYPDVDKKDLFKEGYIAEKSGHSRGSTVDLTIVGVSKELLDAIGIDMGTDFDFFSPLSHTANPSINMSQKIHRLLLKSVMEKYGFVNYDKEWWHFTLKNEPFPGTYFDFPIK